MANCAPTILVTGGAGFIGSHFVERLMSSGYSVVNLDLLTYAGNLNNLADVSDSDRHKFVHGNIGDQDLVLDLLTEHRPMAVFNLAAESHVDRSIDDGTNFIDTNIAAVYRLLRATLAYWQGLRSDEQEAFRFIQMSTDETFGSILEGEFTEESPYSPNSPYAASKAAGDHLVRAFRVTYALPTLIVRASNTYGPRQFPEKLIPHAVICALNGRPLPVYGKGANIRDWMYVGDLVQGLVHLVTRGMVGESYNFSGSNTWRNIDTVMRICGYLNERVPRTYRAALTFVDDRPGHDFRYAMSSEKVRRLFGWTPTTSFEEGLTSTIDWYLDNRDWWQAILERGYSGSRIGLGNR
jgi:dTDP-glucose 4,6-dehydratase